MSALSTFLAGGELTILFNHNQTNSGGTIDQNLAVWAQIAVVDNQGILPTLYFYITSVPNSTLPAVAGSCPEIKLKYVVLPAPFGPTMAVSVPA